jgi:hypothetical protein
LTERLFFKTISDFYIQDAEQLTKKKHWQTCGWHNNIQRPQNLRSFFPKKKIQCQLKMSNAIFQEKFECKTIFNMQHSHIWPMNLNMTSCLSPPTLYFWYQMSYWLRSLEWVILEGKVLYTIYLAVYPIQEKLMLNLLTSYLSSALVYPLNTWTLNCCQTTSQSSHAAFGIHQCIDTLAYLFPSCLCFGKKDNALGKGYEKASSCPHNDWFIIALKRLSPTIYASLHQTISIHQVIVSKIFSFILSFSPSLSIYPCRQRQVVKAVSLGPRTRS